MNHLATITAALGTGKQGMSKSKRIEVRAVKIDAAGKWLDKPREDYPLGTATQFAIAVRTWVS